MAGTERHIEVTHGARVTLRLVLECALILLGSIVAGTLLMIVTFMLPSAPIQRHVYGSAALVVRAEKGQMVDSSDPATPVDTFSDTIMVLNAAYDQGEGVIERAMMGYRMAGDDPENDPWVSLTNPEVNQGRRYAYPRYWHGYLVVLRPLLVFMGYGSVLMLNAGVQAALIAIVVMLLVRKNLERLVAPYLLMTISIRPLVIANCLQDSSVFYVMSAAVLALLFIGRSRLTPARLVRLFLITGILTSFLDLLSWPFASFGVPAVVALAMGSLDAAPDAQASPRALGLVARPLGLLIVLLVAWGVGYAGMWVGKWIVGTLITGQDIIADALGQASVRSSDVVAGQEVTLGTVYWKNVAAFLGGPYVASVIGIATGVVATLGCYRVSARRGLPNAMLVLTCAGAVALGVSARWEGGVAVCAIVLLACMAALLVAGCGIRHEMVARAACYLFLALLPFVWYAAMKNHSFIHTYLFTSRELAITLLAMLAFVADLLHAARKGSSSADKDCNA